jgi:hypothetical protein
MTLARRFALVLLAIAFAAPVAAGAQSRAASSPNSLDAQTKAYFAAVARADPTGFSNTTSSNFHVIYPDGTRLSFDEYFRRISSIAFIQLPPMGMNVWIRGSATTPSGATESVDTLQWYYGGSTPDPERGTNLARISNSHQLMWTKTASGAWLLDEDRITSDYYT